MPYVPKWEQQERERDEDIWGNGGIPVRIHASCSNRLITVECASNTGCNGHEVDPRTGPIAVTKRKLSALPRIERQLSGRLARSPVTDCIYFATVVLNSYAPADIFGRHRCKKGGNIKITRMRKRGVD
jgi:hypothetical protein